MTVNWAAFRYHLFLGISLIGCVIPLATKRHFALHSLPTASVDDRVVAEAAQDSASLANLDFEIATVGPLVTSRAQCTVN